MKIISYAAVIFSLAINLFAQTATPPAGNGSSSNPYQIESLDNLYWIIDQESRGNTFYGKYFLQTADIQAYWSCEWDGGQGFIPISLNNATYDGGGHTVSNIYIARGTTDRNGMFGTIMNSTIKNLGLTNVQITGGTMTGALAGLVIGCTIENCYSTGSVSGGVNGMVGGLIGWLNWAEPVGSVVRGCYSLATVNTPGSIIDVAGGLVGQISNSTITTSYAKGAVFGGSNVGGLIGNSVTGYISKSYCTGEVFGTTNNFGGFAGCFSFGQITNCYSNSNAGSFTGNGNNVAGFIGSRNAGFIDYCYCIGNVGAPSGTNVGGFTGADDFAGPNNSFWNKTVNAPWVTTSRSGTAKTDVEMKTEATYSGWDFSLIWAINSSINNGYPYLQSVHDFPLPVQLTDFIAKQDAGSVKLSWHTATEVNNYGFDIERNIEKSKEDNSWEKIGFVQGHGNSNSPKEYGFIDENPGEGNLKYRLKQIDFDGNYEYYSTIAEVSEKELPGKFSLSQNYPNPFNPETSIRYAISSRQHVTLKIYDIRGNEVITLVNKEQEPGYYSVKFDASSLSSGVYIYKITASEFTSARKLLLVK